MVNFDGNLIVVGGWDQQNGFSNSLYKLMCPHEDACIWEQMGQNLNVARNSFVAMTIPDEMATCRAKVIT